MANPPSSAKFDWKMFRYVPSLAGAIITLVLFFIMTLLHLWQYLRLRQHVVLFVLIGAVCMFVSPYSEYTELTVLLQVKSQATAVV